MTAPPSHPATYINFPFSLILERMPSEKDPNVFPPKTWLERAKYYGDKATLAERKGCKEDMYVWYTLYCQCYLHAGTHPDWGEAKKKDPALAARYKEMKPMYEQYFGKAKVVKEQLRAAEAKPTTSSSSRPHPTRQPSGPETGSIGNLRDRMAALAGHGMAVESVQPTAGAAKRMSRDMPPPKIVAKPAALSGNYLSGAGRARSSSGSHKSPTTTGGAQVIVTASSRPSAPSPAPSFVSTHPTGSSMRSNNQANLGPSAGPSNAASPPSSLIHSASVTPTDRAPSTYTTPQASPLPPPPTVRLNPSPRPPNGAHPPAPPAHQTFQEFERNFPSLSEFTKEWEEPLPNPHSPNGDGADDRSPNGYSNGDAGLPNLPSVPTSRPGLPPPPSKPDFGSFSPRDERSTAPSPVSHNGPSRVDDVAGPSTQRPESSAGRAKEDDSRANGVNGKTQLNFPVAVPTPPTQARSPLPPTPSQSVPPPSLSAPPREKPRFPISNSIAPDQLRGYFLNPSVEMLFLDVRPQEEAKYHVAQEYESRTLKEVNVVQIDPTLLMRDGMDIPRLEDSLSLSPPKQQTYFANRDKYDLVIVYDASSTNWPTSGPLQRLWNMFFNGHDPKKLQRPPVVLIGGHNGWIEFIKMRAGRHQAHKESRSGVLTSADVIVREPDVVSPVTSGQKKANRDMPVYQPSQYSKTITENFASAPQSMTGESRYSQSHTQSYPSSYKSPPPSSHQHHRTGSSYSVQAPIAAPPQASIHPGPGARRRSDYIEHSGQTYSGATPSTSSTPQPQSQSQATSPTSNYYSPPSTSIAQNLTSPRQGVDYPQAHALAKVAMPPPVARPMERHDYSSMGGGYMPGQGHGQGQGQGHLVKSHAQRDLRQNGVVAGGEKVGYWLDVVVGLTGLKNLGNTCYMNSTIQCLSATFPFATFFLDNTFKKSINLDNPLGTKGELAKAWAGLLSVLWSEKYEFLSPMTFRKQIIQFAPQFLGTDQHDSQEFLSFVLDGLHEDLNRIKKKPAPVEMTPEREAMLETSPPEVASESEWQIYRQRNDSLIVDLFQGQYRNRLQCLTCHKTSTTYDAFMYMSLPVPTGKTKVVVQELIDEFVKHEIMEKEDAWYCPRCKTRRRATKTLSISRLPPVLLIQLKRFTTRDGRFWDKSETPVIFPIRGLDLSRYLPARRQDTGAGGLDMNDPRTQVGPFKYDLYAVSNHMGTLSSGHYTAFVKSREGWKYCEDSQISSAQEKDVVVSSSVSWVEQGARGIYPAWLVQLLPSFGYQA
ncbi:hypothetical protein L198_07375 [Cryptococcus wingfieldii CBS 7118]|uniref:ubiquitinyl hydrolase 1 n=1 Tax=Cryptococcus wingfieldii CBS 7118 TaxID=1295528 RepID=A0A1E3IBV3_9TREE|nr:hypothetical protein L198_07375 [Cryptococcus wingfieldii CBS 7118]ODN86082.1 hypothetical protein L198_07375 [Cryptococcus wingfieldii CBS 7118]